MDAIMGVSFGGLYKYYYPLYEHFREIIIYYFEVYLFLHQYQYCYFYP